MKRERKTERHKERKGKERKKTNDKHQCGPGSCKGDVNGFPHQTQQTLSGKWDLFYAICSVLPVTTAIRYYEV